MTESLRTERRPAVSHARRTTGQVAAVASMIEEDRPFSEIAQQILAARGSLDSLLVRLVALELRDCVPGQEARLEVDGLLRTVLGRSMPIGMRSAGRWRHPASDVTPLTHGGTAQ